MRLMQNDGAVFFKSPLALKSAFGRGKIKVTDKDMGSVACQPSGSNLLAFPATKALQGMTFGELSQRIALPLT